MITLLVPSNFSSSQNYPIVVGKLIIVSVDMPFICNTGDRM